jgi:hypothetical protein
MIKEFEVSVEKNYYVTGTVTVKAKDAQSAIKEVNRRIKNDTLNITSPLIKWNDDLDLISPEIKTTGDVD